MQYQKQMKQKENLKKKPTQQNKVGHPCLKYYPIDDSKNDSPNLVAM